MQTTDRGLLALIRHEGVVPGPYLDVKDVWTFGIGHTAAAGPPDPAGMTRGMPADLDAGIREAFRVFRTDLATYEAEVLRAVKVPLEPHEFDALVSFHYNTGGQLLHRKGNDMNWTFARGLVYLACLVASGLAMAGLADFDLATGTFDLRPFNLYALTGAAGGVVSSALASIALWRGWGRK